MGTVLITNSLSLALIGFIQHLFLNLVAGLKLAFFLPVRPWHFHVSPAQVLALFLVSFLLPFSYDLISALPDPRFNPFGLSYQATLYLVFLLSVYLILWIEKCFDKALKLLLLFLSVVPTIWFVCLALDSLVNLQTWLNPFYSEWLVFCIYMLWYLLVIARAISKTLRLENMRVFALVLVFAAANIPPLFYIPTQPLWYAALPEADKSAGKFSYFNIEDTYYLQHDLLAMQAGSLDRQRPGATDMYFLGFAGYAEEDVFKNETLMIKQLLEQRYTGRGNALVLINNEETLSRYPLANRHNLETSLRLIAGKMNRDEDILFLFFTSHGSEDHKLSVHMPPMGLNDITPVQIQNALLGAGIKWRVIIISSCYSGGFIEDLKDPHTLLITAADHDRNSFGCGHDGDFTYFSEAFFQYALSKTHSFVEAFHLAKTRILQREESEDRMPSSPQIVVGEKIEAKLKEFYESLDVSVEAFP